jgi:hypothetical protein
MVGKSIYEMHRLDAREAILRTYLSQLRLANVRTAFMRSEPRPGATLASIVPSETPRDGALSN